MAEFDPLDPTVAPPPIPPTPAPEQQAIPVAAPVAAPAQRGGSFYSYSPEDQDITPPAPPQQAIPTQSGSTGQPATPSSVAPPSSSSAPADDDQTALSTTPGAPPHVTGSSASGNVIAEGDSIAYGLAKYNHLQGNPVGGRNPEAVFKNIEANLKMDPDYYRGSTVVLSPGIMNTNDKNRDAMLKFVPWQIQAIKNAGGNVLLTGVDKGSWKQFNPYLKQLADQTGATFGGELPTTDVHPGPDGYKSYYSSNKLPYGGAPPQGGERLPSIQAAAQPDEPQPLDRTVPGPYGATGYGLGHVAPKAERIAYIEQAAKAAGLNPYALLMTAATEGLHAYVGDKNDPAGRSYGDFQLNESGMGRAARAAGIDISNPATWKQQVDFVVQQMAAHRGDSRWFAGQWHGPRANAPWAVANFSNPDAQPPQGFSLAGGGQRFGGRTGVGRGGGFVGDAGAGPGAGDGSSLQSFQGRVENRDHVGMLTDVASTPTAPGFDGWMARWMTLQNRVVMDAIVNGHADQVEHIEDAFTRMGWQGMNANLMNAYYAMQRGDTQAAAKYGSLAYSYFPDGAHVKFQTNPQGRLFAQRIGEGSGQPIGGPIEVTSQSIMAQMRFTNNPQKFQEFLSKQQAATVKMDLDKAHADYWRGLQKSREEMNRLNNEATIKRALITERGAMDRTIYNAANKPETGQLTLEQMSKEQKDLMEMFTDPIKSGGKVGGFDINTPQGQEKLALVPALGRSIMANSKGRLLATDVKPIIDGIISGRFKPRATNTGLIAILDTNENPVAAIDMETAKRFGLAPATQPAAPAQTQAPQQSAPGP